MAGTVNITYFIFHYVYCERYDEFRVWPKMNCKHKLTLDSTVKNFTVLSRVNLCLHDCLLWKQGQYIFTVLSMVNLCLEDCLLWKQGQYTFTVTFRSNSNVLWRLQLATTKIFFSNVYSLLDSVIFIRSSWFGHLNQPPSLRFNITKIV